MCNKIVVGKISGMTVTAAAKSYSNVTVQWQLIEAVAITTIIKIHKNISMTREIK